MTIVETSVRAQRTDEGSQSQRDKLDAMRGIDTAARIAIEDVRPAIDGGAVPIKRVVGDVVTVSADIFSDGHDKIAAALQYRIVGEANWREVPLIFVDNDRWQGAFTVDQNAMWEYRIAGWRDEFRSWRDEIEKKYAAGQKVSLELEEGRRLIADAADNAAGRTSSESGDLKRELEWARSGPDEKAQFERFTSNDLMALVGRAGKRSFLTLSSITYRIWVDRQRAAFSAWYEMFPRSQSGDPARHGTFDDVIEKLPYVSDLGFDVLYFTPIHPIGKINRKGRNNSLTATPEDPGSPYAIGSDEGGHDALHPELGDFEDFARLISSAKEHGLEIALDFAIQCAPDHPWIKEHPEWFEWRPDGSIRFAENPPKKYEDIVNVSFYGEAFPDIWYALRDVILFWAEKGVRIFRVDNPHTKPFPFWQWMIAEVQTRFPDVIFLSEAFTRPKVMKRLAKIGFSQSYTYYTWRNTKAELTEYLTELSQTDVRNYYRPNFFVNTPDINPVFLQTSGRPGYRTRFVLAATLAGNYGLYNGFEICEGAPVPGKEEYLDSEKYEIRAWDFDKPDHIKEDIRLINKIRRSYAIFRDLSNLAFFNVWNDEILYYGKRNADLSEFLLFAVNLDPTQTQGAHFEVPLWEFGLEDDASIDVEDLLTGERFTWTGKVQHMLLDPERNPYQIWRLAGPAGGAHV
jgi:starch synthase (maltosyl-transferring)